MTAHQIARLCLLSTTVIFLIGAIAYLFLALRTRDSKDWYQCGYHLCAAMLQLNVMGMGK